MAREVKDGNTDQIQVLLSRIAKIQHKVDSLEQTTAFSLRADSGKHIGEVKKVFGRSTERARVYLAVNGMRNVQEIAAHLKMQRQNVGVELKKLAEEGLLEVVEGVGSGIIYAKTALARTLRIPQFVANHFGLEADGRMAKGRSSRTRRRAK